jgi:hypothetical protein
MIKGVFMNLKVVVSKVSTFNPSEVSFGAIAALYNEAQTLANDDFDVSFTHGDQIVVKSSKVFDLSSKNWLETSRMYLEISEYEKLGFTAQYE